VKPTLSGTTQCVSRCVGMIEGDTDFVITPALRLKGGVVVRTLEQAADFVRHHDRAGNPLQRDGVLHKIEGAFDPQSMQDAANAFRAWAESEGLVEGFQ
jgi:hypothetical protein